jgi:DNA polymerase-3 subunit beta
MKAGDLAKALGGVVRLIESRNINPVLDCVLIEPTDDTLSVTAHNLDACATVECPLASTDVLAPTPIAVKGSRLHALAKSLPAASSVELQIGEERLTVASGKSRYKLDLVLADTFPPRLKAADGVWFELESKTAARLLELPEPFAARDKRYYLEGVFLHADGEELVAVATDGHRACRVWAPLPPCGGTWPRNGERLGGIIPLKVAAEIVRLESAIQLRLTDALIEARTPTTTLVSKLIDATYVAYDRIFPDPGASHFTCDRKALSEIVGRLGALNPQDKLTPVIGFRWHEGAETVCVTPASISRHGRGLSRGDRRRRIRGAQFQDRLHRGHGPRASERPTVHRCRIGCRRSRHRTGRKSRYRLGTDKRVGDRNDNYVDR